MKRFFKKLFKRGDFMTRADKAYYGHKFKTMFWSVFSMIIISWVGTNLVLCALATNVSSNWDIIYEAEQPTVLPIGREVNVAIMNKTSFVSGSGNDTVESVTFDKYNADGKYMVGDVDVVATCNTSSTMQTLNDDVTLYRMNGNKNVYILSNKKIQANPDSSFMFYCLDSCMSYTFNNFDTSLVTNMMGMFAGDTAGYSWFQNVIEALANSDAAVSVASNDKAHTLADRYAWVPNIEHLDLSDWDTSNVTNMYGMFYFCESLTSINLQGWNTSKVTNMSYMFDLQYMYYSSITTLDLSSFDTSSVQNYERMFDIHYLKTVYVSERWNIPASVLPSGCSYVQKEYTGK